GEDDAPIGGIGLTDPGESTRPGPVEGAGVDHDAGDDRPVSGDVFGGGMEHDVSAPLGGPTQIGRGEGVVDHERDTGGVGDVGEYRNVGDRKPRVAYGLG